MHEIHVTVVSPEEASYGVAEFWSEGRHGWCAPGVEQLVRPD